VRALDEVSLDVKQGDILGIVGRNGSGKTTLLKVLARITPPSAGRAEVRGRIGSLLEVGTGFSFELTGRENIMLYGAVLGMKRTEILARFDEIVEFSGIGAYLDTPVKRYSTGMFMRLAFSVAAHLRTDILFVDEVLAVGDAPFQQKCLNTMQNASDAGRTVLFVSHNLGAVRELCTRGVHLDQGRLLCDGTPEDALQSYQKSFDSTPAEFVNETVDESLPLQILGLRVEGADGRLRSTFDIGDPIMMRVRFLVRKSITGSDVAIALKRNGVTAFTSFDTDERPSLLNERLPGTYEYVVHLPAEQMKPGFYTVSADCGIVNVHALDMHRDAVSFTIQEIGENTAMKSYAGKRAGVVRLPVKWE
jgi:lipopolysaccharide transport system ATP-binding protein